jgi:asparagine synthetase B (glutamine-hydrolysing)|eukprot:COSAG01_NODE_2070_length_8500_cov_7.053803_1_plen_101_part_00
MLSVGRAAARGRGRRQGQEEGRDEEQWRRQLATWLRHQRRQFMADYMHEGVPVRVSRAHLIHLTIKCPEKGLCLPEALMTAAGLLLGLRRPACRSAAVRY